MDDELFNKENKNFDQDVYSTSISELEKLSKKLPNDYFAVLSQILNCIVAVTALAIEGYDGYFRLFGRLMYKIMAELSGIDSENKIKQN